MAEIRIPQGMRDLTQSECVRKKELQRRVERIFDRFGYQQIITPAIEYYSTYENAFEDAKDEEFYKFFDQDGKILTLRADMTVPIARVCASKFTNVQPPYRFYYCSDVFKVRHVFAGKRSQVSDCGIELIGLDEKSDIEVLYTALEVMEQFGTETYQLEIGNSGFFKKACAYLNINDADQKKLADLIDRKSLVDLEVFLTTAGLEEQAVNFFMTLPMLVGKKDALDQAEAIAFHQDLKDEVNSLRNLFEAFEKLGKADHISFDFGKVPHLEYYTGIIFEGYVNSAATSVLSGGRYDHLLEKFGRNLPACGFSVKLDYLIDALDIEMKKPCQLMYPYGREVDALLKAKELREQYDVEMIPWQKDEMEVIL